MLEYPPHRYDDNGRLLPPVILTLLLCYLCRGLFIFLLGHLNLHNPQLVVQWFYPKPELLQWALMQSVLPLICLILLAYRNILWNKKMMRWSYCLFPFLCVSLLWDVGLLLWQAHQSHWVYHQGIALPLVMSTLSLIWLYRTRYLRHMVLTWKY